MRTLVAAILIATVPASVHAQTALPPWPETNFNLTSCPKVAPSLDPSQRSWKHGDAEQNEFSAATKATDPRERAALLTAFVEKYPDSDFRGLALVTDLAAFAGLKDIQGQVHVAQMMTEAEEAEAPVRVTGFMTLSSLLSPYVLPDDPEKQRKLADLVVWVSCGNGTVVAMVRTPNTPQEAFEKSRQYAQSIFDRTAGFVALMRGDYLVAIPQLEAARKQNPQDALTNLWLSQVYFLSDDPNQSKGIFYLARAAWLAPQVPQMADLLKQLYVIGHGSEKGLTGVRTLAQTNIAPPPNFIIQPPPLKEKHHYGTAIAETAIIGLLIYGAVKCPSCLAGGAPQRPGIPSVVSPKIMIFGGPGHQTYLGCLSCDEFASDSVFNESGVHGSRYNADSIWNPYGQFGSAYSAFSACNPYASDPPVIVDESATAYGRLTVNQTSYQLGMGARFYNWLASAACHR
jgi:hypothetical protein